MKRCQTNRRPLGLSYQALEPRQLLAGNVDVSFRGGTLRVTGDANNNSVAIAATANGFSISGPNSTQLNGVNTSLQFTGSIRKAYIELGDGDDSVSVSGINIKNKLQIIGGNGNDQIQLSEMAAKKSTIHAGTGDDSVTLNSVTLKSRSTMDVADGNDLIALTAMTVGKYFKVSGGVGDDVFSTDSMVADRQFTLDLGAGDDECLMSGATSIGKKSKILLGQGADFAGVLPSQRSTSANFQEKVTIDCGPDDDVVVLDQGVNLSRANVQGGNGSSDQLVDNSSSVGSIANGFEGAANLDLNQSLMKIYQRLRNGGIDTTRFGEVVLQLNPVTQRVTINDESPTVSVMWDQAAQQAVAEKSTGPTIASRAYAILHTAMFDAWSAYDGPAKSTTLTDTLQRPAPENTEANKTKAMSFAAYRVLKDLFPDKVTIFNNVMTNLGFNAANESVDVSQAYGIGNRMAQELLSIRHDDGANQLGDEAQGTSGVPYSDTTGYTSVNGIGDTTAIEKWTPERVPIDSTAATQVRSQKFLTPQWGTVTPFGLSSGSQLRPDAPEPFLLVPGTVDLANKTITTTSDNQTHTISKSLIGTIINPKFIEQAQAIVDLSAGLTDKQKLIAEFWEDGGGTAFPPGTWMTFGEFVSARDQHTLDQDAKMFFALANAEMDAGIATWEAKTHYDYTRPVRAIRELGKLGLVGTFDSTLGGFAINAWSPTQGTQKILAEDFLTYQTPGADPSPPFSEYTSGHSSFSAAGARILELFTGTSTFGGFVSFAPGDSRFEPNLTPVNRVTLSWDTFQAAANEAGLSRLYGGIHFEEGDLNGRAIGKSVGDAVWAKAKTFFG